MAVATGTALALGAAGSLAGGIMGAKGAKSAARTQAASADAAAQLQYQAQQDQLDYLNQSRAEGLNYLNVAENRQRDLLSQIPGRVTPIYDRGYRELEQLGRQGTGAYGSEIERGYTGAAGALGGGFQRAESALGGLTDAQRVLGTGYGTVSDIYGNLLPQTQDLIAGGQGKAEAALTGFDPALYTQEQLGALGGAKGEIMQAGQPYTDIGQQALQAYSQYALDPFSSPLYQQQLEQGQEALQERLATMGLSQSSAAIEQEQEMIRRMQAEALDRAQGQQGNLAQMGQGQTQLQQQLGAQLAGQQADVYGRAGQLETGVEAQRAAQLADLYQRATGQQLDVAGMVASGQAGAAQGQAQDISQLIAQQALTEADLARQQGVAASALQAEKGQLLGQNQQDLYSRLMQFQAGKTADIAGVEQQGLLNLANLYGNMGAQRANIATGTGAAQASAAGQTGTNLANIAMQSGQAQADLKGAKYGAYQGALSSLTGLGTMYGMGAFSNGGMYANKPAPATQPGIVDPYGMQPRSLKVPGAR